MRHVCRFADDHGDQVLRAGNDDNTVQRHGLKDGERNVSGSGRAVHQKNVHIPNGLLPELLHRSGNQRAAPDHRLGFVAQEQIDRDHIDSGFAGGGDHAVLVAVNFNVFHSESLRNRRPGNIRVQNADAVALAAQKHRKHGGNKRFANAAFAAHHANDVLDLACRICRQIQVLGRGAGRAALGTSGTIMGAFFCHGKKSPFSVAASIIHLFLKKNKPQRRGFAKNCKKIHKSTCKRGQIDL